jgi:hypothetical protein
VNPEPVNACIFFYFNQIKVEEEWVFMANAVGKKYTCDKCGATYIVTRGGDGKIICCGQAMEIKK